MKKSVLAVVLGALFIVVISTAVDSVLHLTGVYPPWGMPIGDKLASLALAYRIIIGIAGGWLTARLAPRAPIKHSLYLGLLGTVLGVVGTISTWNSGLSPRWYAIALVILAVPQCLLGGLLRQAGMPNKSTPT